jgi:glycosyltransferase involved in cell wall biosynthesis
MKQAESAGAYVILNRGSTHILHQVRVLTDEYARWGVRGYLPTARTVERELQEYDGADLIVVPSGQAAETFADRGFGSNRVVVNVTGVDSNRFAPDRHTVQAQSTFTLLYVGVDAIRKGLPDALEGWVLAGRPGRFIVVSSTPRWLKQRYRAHGVEFRRPDHNVPRLLRVATAFLFPSLEEGHARVLLEALAVGLPIIATRESGACDLPASQAIRVVAARDPDSIANAIEAVRAERDKEALRSAALRIAADFSWNRYVEEHLSFYPDTVTNSESPRRLA